MTARGYTFPHHTHTAVHIRQADRTHAGADTRRHASARLPPSRPYRPAPRRLPRAGTGSEYFRMTARRHAGAHANRLAACGVRDHPSLPVGRRGRRAGDQARIPAAAECIINVTENA
jgi:hypothetical protein